MNPGTIKRTIKRKMTATKRSRSKLMRETDKAYSLHVRQKYADRSGLVGCFTCPYVAHWKKMQNGHYIPRSVKYLRWELDNLRPQCFVCNMRNQGMPHVFREKLVLELGEARVLEMEVVAKKTFTEPDSWIEAKLKEICEPEK